MFKQRRLAFIEEGQLERLWKEFPEQARSEVTQHYARLMGRTAVQRIRRLRKKQEAGNEPGNR
jgi:hypothetical protein